MPTVPVNGARLEYDITGADGPVVVQLHGLMSSRTRDAQLGLDLGRALRGHRVIRLDARGHGGSSGTTEPGDYAWDRLADDLLAALDAIVPGESVHGLGPSMGTGTLLHAVLREPARFDSLTLMLPPTAWGTRPAQAQSYLTGADLIEREGMAAFVELGSTTPVPPALAEAPQTGPAVDEALLPTVLRGAALADLPPRKRLVDVTTPTLILAWTGDHTHPLRTATKLDETLPHRRLVVARTPYGVMAWPGLFAEHVITAGVETPATGAITLPTGRPSRPDRRSAPVPR